MPWRGQTKSHCRSCGRARGEDERFSARGKCEECGDTAASEEVRQMMARSGPYFEHWRRQMAASVGGVLLDDAQDEA